MNLVAMLLKNPKVVGQIAKQFGLSDNQAQSAMAPMLGNLVKSMQGNVSKEGGLEALLGAIKSGNHGSIFDNLNQLSSLSSVEEGNGILGHLLGDKEKSREVAKEAAKVSGVDYGITKKILPLLAKVAMAGLNKGASKSGLMPQLASMLGGQKVERNQLSGFARLLDLDGDGKVIDNILGLAKKFLR